MTREKALRSLARRTVQQLQALLSTKSLNYCKRKERCKVMRYAHIRFTTDSGRHINVVVPESRITTYTEAINWNAETTVHETKKQASEYCERQKLIDDFGVKVRKTISGRYVALDQITDESIAVAETVGELRKMLEALVCVEGSGE